jgi:hypothetical protein
MYQVQQHPPGEKWLYPAGKAKISLPGLWGLWDVEANNQVPTGPPRRNFASLPGTLKSQRHRENLWRLQTNGGQVVKKKLSN